MQDDAVATEGRARELTSFAAPVGRLENVSASSAAVAFGVLSRKSLLHTILARLSKRVYRGAGAIISLGEVMTQRWCSSS